MTTADHRLPEADDVQAVVTRLLRTHGQRATMARRTVLAVLVGADHEDRHLSVEAIADRMGSTGPDLSTVYRTLGSLAELGLVHQTPGEGGAALYRLVEAGTDDHHHAHLRCLNCGAVSDAPGELVAPLRASLAERDFDLDIAHTVLVGVCRTCSG